jgi:DAHP synthase ferredoxin-like domain
VRERTKTQQLDAAQGFEKSAANLKEGRGFFISNRSERRRQAMIVNMSPKATEEQINHIIERIKEYGYQARLIRGEERTVIGVVGNAKLLLINKVYDYR